MTAVPTRASLHLRGDGTLTVDPFIRLDGNTLIHCCTYDEHAPVLAVTAANVQLSVSAPDVHHVTDEDVKWGRKLAEAVSRYVAELERRAAIDRDADAEGRAA